MESISAYLILTFVVILKYRFLEYEKGYFPYDSALSVFREHNGGSTIL
jgi:hypothetical protein